VLQNIRAGGVVSAKLLSHSWSAREQDHQGVTDVLVRDLGLELGESEYCIEATAADEAVASPSAVAVGSPLLLLETLTRLVDGRPVQLGYQRGRADRMPA